jgi:hypothetical protein
MGKVLVEANKVTCGPVPPAGEEPPPGEEPSPHLGTVKMTGAESLVVNNSKVLTTASVNAATIPSGCVNPIEAGGPCTTVSMSSGASTCLKVDGEFVVLASLQASTDRASAVTVDSKSVNNNLLQAE